MTVEQKTSKELPSESDLDNQDQKQFEEQEHDLEVKLNIYVWKNMEIIGKDLDCAENCSVIKRIKEDAKSYIEEMIGQGNTDSLCGVYTCITKEKACKLIVEVCDGSDLN